jgi:16S rRNA (cytosine1402-N4)-methyltransferase
MTHVSVLLHEAIDGLELVDGDIFVDATLGNAGHTAYAMSLGKYIQVVGIDLDPDAIIRSKNVLPAQSSVTRTHFVNDTFRNLDRILDDLHISHINKIIFDFGFSSDQLESGRGFSFQADEPLLMTFGKSDTGLTAREILNTWDEESIQSIIREYGEERFARRIASAIVEARKSKAILTTTDLVNIILSATPGWYHHGRLNPATRTFQAIRIAVNDELGAIKEGLEKAFNLLAPSGRIAAISFHSLEDRIVKTMFRKWKDEDLATLITKRPIVAKDEEIKANPRARSAKLRLIERNP